jgi:hypothetical protein
MSNCVTPYEAFHANLSAAGTTLMLCRANLRSLNISQAETAKTLWKIERQICELEAMGIVAELGCRRIHAANLVG